MPTESPQFALLDWVQLAKSAYEHAGYIGVALALVVILLNGYRTEFVQRFLPAPMQWDVIPWWIKRALPIATAFGTTALTALVGGVSIKMALLGAVPVGLSAAGYHAFAQWFANTPKVKNAIEGASPRVQAAMRMTSVRVKLDPERVPAPVPAEDTKP